MGLLWDNSKETKYWDDWCEDRPFSIISIFGNHDCFPVIRACPTEVWNGALTYRVRPHVRYVENGEIFNINDFSFLAVGGARSHDMWCRIEGKDWWREEIPSYEEMLHAINNLASYDNKVDFVLSHCAPSSIVRSLFFYENDEMTDFLEKCIAKDLKFRSWFFAHYHQNIDYGNFHCLYHDFIEIMPDGSLEKI